MQLWRVLAVCFAVSCVGMQAAALSLLTPQNGEEDRPALIEMDVTRGSILQSRGSDASRNGASLFSGQAQGSLLSRMSPPQTKLLPSTAKGVVGLRLLIAAAEAGSADYDAVQHAARIKPRKKPTKMTIQEIYNWIDATPGQHHAIGRYQFIPATLKRLVRKTGIATKTRFTPEVQDLLADELFKEAGLEKFKRGKLSQKGFMNNLAKIWAGLPTSSGKSYYHGLAGNYATITWARYKSEMNRIFGTG